MCGFHVAVPWLNLARLLEATFSSCCTFRSRFQYTHSTPVVVALLTLVPHRRQTQHSWAVLELPGRCGICPDSEELAGGFWIAEMVQGQVDRSFINYQIMFVYSTQEQYLSFWQRWHTALTYRYSNISPSKHIWCLQ